MFREKSLYRRRTANQNWVCRFESSSLTGCAVSSDNLKLGMSVKELITRTGCSVDGRVQGWVCRFKSKTNVCVVSRAHQKLGGLWLAGRRVGSQGGFRFASQSTGGVVLRAHNKLGVSWLAVRIRTVSQAGCVV